MNSRVSRKKKVGPAFNLESLEVISAAAPVELIDASPLKAAGSSSFRLSSGEGRRHNNNANN